MKNEKRKERRTVSLKVLQSFLSPRFPFIKRRKSINGKEDRSNIGNLWGLHAFLFFFAPSTMGGKGDEEKRKERRKGGKSSGAIPFS